MQRPLQIVFKEMDSSPSMEAAIRRHVDRLERLHPNIIGCRVAVSIPRRAQGGKLPLGLTVEVELPGRPLVVGSSAEERRDAKSDHGAVVTHAFDAVERQLEAATERRRGDIKQHGAAGETGMVVRLFREQSYGFVEVKGSPELYFTANAVADEAFARLQVGTMVQVTRAGGEGPMGPQASSIKLLDHRHSPGH